MRCAAGCNAPVKVLAEFGANGPKGRSFNGGVSPRDADLASVCGALINLDQPADGGVVHTKIIGERGHRVVAG